MSLATRAIIVKWKFSIANYCPQGRNLVGCYNASLIIRHHNPTQLTNSPQITESLALSLPLNNSHLLTYWQYTIWRFIAATKVYCWTICINYVCNPINIYSKVYYLESGYILLHLCYLLICNNCISLILFIFGPDSEVIVRSSSWVQQHQRSQQPSKQFRRKQAWNRCSYFPGDIPHGEPSMSERTNKASVHILIY